MFPNPCLTQVLWAEEFDYLREAGISLISGVCLAAHLYLDFEEKKEKCWAAQLPSHTQQASDSVLSLSGLSTWAEASTLETRSEHFASQQVVGRINPCITHKLVPKW